MVQKAATGGRAQTLHKAATGGRYEPPLNNPR
jgi:hypothetical protein